MAGQPKALYQRLLESQRFVTQAEAEEWLKIKKAEYKAGGIAVKAEIIPADATRRMWVVEIYAKVTE